MFNLSLQNFTLLGPMSIIGRGMVLHESENDPAVDPMSNMANMSSLSSHTSRIACGVIGQASSFNIYGNGAKYLAPKLLIRIIITILLISINGVVIY